MNEIKERIFVKLPAAQKLLAWRDISFVAKTFQYVVSFNLCKSIILIIVYIHVPIES